MKENGRGQGAATSAESKSQPTSQPLKVDTG